MSYDGPSLSICLAAAAASGVVPLGEAARHLSAIEEERTWPLWPALRRARRRPGGVVDCPELPELVDGTVVWRGQALGKILLLYKGVSPQEQQARIAYDIFSARFLHYVWDRFYCPVLAENVMQVTLFVPRNQTATLDSVWAEFVKHAFSRPELRRTFLAVLNSVKLSGRGFSPPDLQPIGPDHAVALLGLYAASVYQRDWDMKRKERRVAEAKSTGERARLEKELAKNHANYDAAIAAMHVVLDGQKSERHREIKEVIDGTTRTGRTQIGPRPDYMRLCVERAKAVLGRMEQGQYATIRPLLSREPALSTARRAGDDAKQACYLCGTPLGSKDGMEVSKLVVESPEQALQSKPSAQRPTACFTCIQISMMSPIKPTDQAVIVSLKRAGDGAYLYDERLRQMVLGELNLVAGRYCQIACTERVDGKDPLSQKLGQVQYAMLKVADLFPADCLSDHAVIASISGSETAVQRRQMVALAGLLGVLNVRAANISASRRAVAQFSSAVRLLQDDRYFEATYEMVGAFRRGEDLNPVARSHLDALARRIEETWWEELTEQVIGENAMTTEEPEEPDDSDLRRYRDVLALTGLIAPFVAEARRDLKSEDQKTVDRELSKLIEHVEGTPQEFCYDLAQTLSPFRDFIPSALLSDGQDNHTITKQALALLKEAGLPAAENAGSTAQSPAHPASAGEAAEPTASGIAGGTQDRQQSRISYRLTIDMLQGVYVYLFAKRYHTRKERRDLAYQLKLSLYARFPRLISASKKEE